MRTRILYFSQRQFVCIQDRRRGSACYLHSTGGRPPMSTPVSTLMLDRVAQENCSFQVVWISYPLSPIGYKKVSVVRFSFDQFVVIIMSFPTGLNPVASHLLGTTLPWPVPPGQSTSGLPNVGPGSPIAPVGQMTTRPSDLRGTGSGPSSLPPR